jgi:hypothetical protein
MERDNTEKKPLWKKLGGGSLRFRNKIIKPGEVFAAYPEEIPEAFRKFVASVSGTVDFGTAQEAPISPTYPITQVAYTIEARTKVEPRGKTKLWFNIIDKEGTILNEKALKKEDAEKLVTYDLVGTNGKVLNDKPLKKEEAEDLLKAMGK